MNKNHVMLSIVLVCMLATQTAVCAQDKAGLINKAQETYRTFKKDMKCVFSKQPCTRTQKKRLIKQGAALTGIVVVLAGLGIGGGFGIRALKKRGKKELSDFLGSEEEDDLSFAGEELENGGESSGDEVPYVQDSSEGVGEEEKEPEIVPKVEAEPVSIPQISEEVKRRAELELKLRKATLKKTIEDESKWLRSYKYPMSKKQIQAAVPVKVPLVVVGAEEPQKEEVSSDGEPEVVEEPKQVVQVPPSALKKEATIIDSTIGEIVLVDEPEERVVRFKENKSKLPTKYQKYRSIPPRKTGNIQNDVDALYAIQLELRAQKINHKGEIEATGEADVFTDIIRDKDVHTRIGELYSKDPASLTYDDYKEIWDIYDRAGLWK